MKVKQRLQLLLLSISIVSFFLLIFLFLLVGRDQNDSPSQSLNPSASLEITDEEISFFIDSNNNNTKDSEEDLCSQCVGTQILLEVNMNSGREIISKVVGENSSLSVESTEISSLWGYLPEEKLIVPMYTFSPEMRGQDIFVPVVESTYMLIAENANITSISSTQLSERNYQIDFEFGALVPALNSFINSETPVWFLFYPDIENKDNYYLASGTVNSLGESKSLSTTYWHVLEDQADLENIDNFMLLIPAN